MYELSAKNDRLSLSMKNRWFDSENRVYIIYQVAD
ncbi:MAG: replication initiator protein A, partial [Oscillospiraceae bacterium]|nr:replication initiator protein A [Oscillospiraceae bacterium]